MGGRLEGGDRRPKKPKAEVKKTGCGAKVVFMLLRHLVVRDIRGREERVGPVVEHFLGQLFEDWLRFHVQVTHHRYAVPATQELDGVAVYPAAEERHCASCAGGPCREVSGVDSCVMLKRARRKPHLACDVHGTNVEAVVGAVIVRRESYSIIDRLLRSGEVLAVRAYKPNDGMDWATEAVTTEALCDNFAFTLVFLSREMKPHAGSACKVEEGRGGDVELSGPNVEVHIAQSERLFVISTIFGGPKEVVER